MSITKEHNRFIPCSLLSDCKNVQKSALKSVNVQRTGKSMVLGKNNAYLWLKYLIISTLISIIKVADVRIF